MIASPSAWFALIFVRLSLTGCTRYRAAPVQSSEVWFLAGTYGTPRTIRTCRVPRDKYLFFPLINYVVARSPAAIPAATR